MKQLIISAISNYLENKRHREETYIQYNEKENMLVLKGINSPETVFNISTLTRITIRAYGRNYELELHYCCKPFLVVSQAKFAFTEDSARQFFITINEIWINNTSTIDYYPCFFNLDNHIKNTYK